MKVSATMTDLDENQWDIVHRHIRTEYEFQPSTIRTCVTFTRGEEERHVEMPFQAFAGFLLAMNLNMAMQPVMTRLGRDLNEWAKKIQDTRKAQAEAKPDGVPESPTCEHGSPVETESPGLSGPVRTYRDGCQSYGPRS